MRRPSGRRSSSLVKSVCLPRLVLVNGFPDRPGPIISRVYRLLPPPQAGGCLRPLGARSLSKVNRFFCQFVLYNRGKQGRSWDCKRPTGFRLVWRQGRKMPPGRRGPWPLRTGGEEKPPPYLPLSFQPANSAQYRRLPVALSRKRPGSTIWSRFLQGRRHYATCVARNAGLRPKKGTAGRSLLRTVRWKGMTR